MSLLNKIARGNIEICTSPQFILVSALVSTLQHKVVEDAPFPIAATDGLNVYWNAETADKLSQKELNYVIIHEAGHIMFSHLQMWKYLFTEDAQTANFAADFVVNGFIEQTDPQHAITLMPIAYPGCLDSKYFGKTTREVYDDLKAQSQKGNQGKGQPKSFDVHNFKDLTPEQKKQVEIALNIGKQRAKMAGRSVDVTEVEEVNWEELLAQWVMRTKGAGSKSSWDRPNRRHIGRGIYFPTRYSESLQEAVVAIDVSGSTSSFVHKFVSHCKELIDSCKVSKLHVLYWDCGVENHEIYDFAEAKEYSEKTKVGGGGGTMFAPVLDYIHKHNINPAFMIGMTDAELSDWGNEPEFPTIWLNTTKQPIPYGEVINITV